MSIERLSVESKQELERIITEQLSSIEENMTIVCSHVPINDNATLDILCHDENGQLAIIQISTREDDTMLLSGLQSIDYVDKFKSFLKATYTQHKIDNREKPRLILIAPSFSNAVRNAAESMRGMRIDLYEWEYLKLGDQKGFHFQSVFGSKAPDKFKDTRELERRHEQKPRRKEQSTENQDQLSEPAPPNPDETSQEPQKQEFPRAEEEPQKKKLKLF